MKSKQVVITIKDQANSFFVGAIPGHNRTTKEPGFLACWFPAKDGTPTNMSEGKTLADIMFATEDIAIKDGEKILKAKIKADFLKYK
ncbi:hypothetical protein [Chryseobacterium indoltheticum]|uniref:hypothetical protein n=1 Tax=Chryseobacterium indoltheticum TaxID=254 RepID=UPI0019120B97|nr:hypothetical protein [Chryseobacterium indoltheticum]QQQ28931.1 hypothetical protein JJL46_02645 [Chryseobacterium indoltheticum]